MNTQDTGSETDRDNLEIRANSFMLQLYSSLPTRLAERDLQTGAGAGRTAWRLMRIAVSLTLPSLLVITALPLRDELLDTTGMRRRVADLTDLRNALEAYRTVYGVYPRSIDEQWSGRFNVYGPASENWIPGLAPRFIKQLPRDPRMITDGDKQYLYRSNRQDFKLLSFFPEDDCSLVARRRPELLDPVRGGGKSLEGCHAYGFWSPGAVGW